MPKKSKIIAHCPRSVEVGKRSGQNSLVLDVNLYGNKAGSLHIAQGSVEWWPDYKKVNAHRFDWWKFINLLEERKVKRSKR
jgi:Ni,Fe-hydrogenase maturation factor